MNSCWFKRALFSQEFSCIDRSDGKKDTELSSLSLRRWWRWAALYRQHNRLGWNLRYRCWHQFEQTNRLRNRQGWIFSYYFIDSWKSWPLRCQLHVRIAEIRCDMFESCKYFHELKPFFSRIEFNDIRKLPIDDNKNLWISLKECSQILPYMGTLIPNKVTAISVNKLLTFNEFLLL